MGKNYYCDYCDKSFKGGVSIRQKHINGSAHQAAKKAYYDKFADPKVILETELKKKPCNYFQQGCCQFGDSCHFSHYTPEQIGQLQEQVRRMEYKEWIKHQPKIYSLDLVDAFLRHREEKKKSTLRNISKQLWKYPEEWLEIQESLPPSLRLLELEKCVEKTETWGS